MDFKQLIIILLPHLTVLATTAGAGGAAAQLFNQVRAWHPSSGELDTVIERALYTRGGARMVVMVLSALISVGASVLIAYAGDKPIEPSLTEALGAVICSQMVHLSGMLGEPSQDARHARLAANGLLAVSLELEDRE